MPKFWLNLYVSQCYARGRLMLPNGANHQSLKELPKQATSGRSMRQQAFVAFNFGMRPADVARMLELRETSAYRYFQQWKKCHRFLE